MFAKGMAGKAFDKLGGLDFIARFGNVHGVAFGGRHCRLGLRPLDNGQFGFALSTLLKSGDTDFQIGQLCGEACHWIRGTAEDAARGRGYRGAGAVTWGKGGHA